MSESKHAKPSTSTSDNEPDNSSDNDSIDLDDDFDLGGYREQRLEELKRECVSIALATRGQQI